MTVDYKLIQESKFPFYIEPRLAEKLDLMIQRLDKADAWVVIDGDEGSGKTNMAGYIMKYISCKTGRKFNEENFYFDAKALFERTKNTTGEILNWDEAALGGLSRQWWNRNQINLMQFGMSGRIKHHFVVLCIPKFDKLGEYFIRDRSLGLIHTYESKNLQKGHYAYFNKKAKEKLWETYRRTRRRDYIKFMTFHGRFCETISKLIDEEKYEDKKLKAISEIGTDKKEKNLLAKKMMEQKAQAIYNMKIRRIPTTQIAEIYNCTQRTIEYIIKAFKEGKKDGVVDFEAEDRVNINNSVHPEKNVIQPSVIQ